MTNSQIVFACISGLALLGLLAGAECRSRDWLPRFHRVAIPVCVTVGVCAAIAIIFN